MKDFLTIGLTSAVLASIVACSNDNEQQQQVTLPTIFEGKRITEYAYSLGANYTEKEVFSYQAGKLVSYSEIEISPDGTYEDKYTVGYNDRQIKVSWKDDSDSEVCTYSLDENGFATSALLTTIEDEDTWNTYYTFEYDTNGYLIKITEKYDGEKPTTTKIEWNEGDASSFTRDGNKHTYIYTSVNNKGGILPLDNGWLDVDAELQIAYYAGILGKPTKHLVASRSSSNQLGYQETFQYKLDAEGYVEYFTTDYREEFPHKYTFK